MTTIHAATTAAAAAAAAAAAVAAAVIPRVMCVFFGTTLYISKGTLCCHPCWLHGPPTPPHRLLRGQRSPRHSDIATFSTVLYSFFTSSFFTLGTFCTAPLSTLRFWLLRSGKGLSFSFYHLQMKFFNRQRASLVEMLFTSAQTALNAFVLPMALFGFLFFHLND
jgi:hypothetical protein